MFKNQRELCTYIGSVNLSDDVPGKLMLTKVIQVAQVTGKDNKQRYARQLNRLPQLVQTVLAAVLLQGKVSLDRLHTRPPR